MFQEDISAHLLTAAMLAAQGCTAEQDRRRLTGGQGASCWMW
jgi:hypothetical protein